MLPIKLFFGTTIKYQDLKPFEIEVLNQYILLTARVSNLSNFQGFSLQTNNLPQHCLYFDKYSDLLQKSHEVSQPRSAGVNAQILAALTRQLAAVNPS